jgi:hypothetical protein
VGNKDKFIQNSKNVDNEGLYEFISNVLDIGYIAGNELLSNETIGYNATTYSAQYMTWINNNWRKMESGILNIIVNKIY